MQIPRNRSRTACGSTVLRAKPLEVSGEAACYPRAGSDQNAKSRLEPPARRHLSRYSCERGEPYSPLLPDRKERKLPVLSVDPVRGDGYRRRCPQLEPKVLGRFSKSGAAVCQLLVHPGRNDALQCDSGWPSARRPSHLRDQNRDLPKPELQ